MSSNIIIAALYQFVALPDYIQLKPRLLDFCQAQNLRGTLLLASEGINGTVAGSRQAVDALLTFLHQDGRFDNLEYKESLSDHWPFHRMKVALKKEIVTLGVPSVDPTCMVGQYVEPKDWNTLISDPDVLVVDTRNQYEYDIGTFKGAVNPETTNFRQFPDYASQLDQQQHKKIAMFCTGGIRCEKATAYLLQQGFEEVFHLKGGILKYLEEVPAKESLWQGECFVFDQRVAVKQDLTTGSYEQCYACRHPVSAQDRQSSHYVKGVSCPHCYQESRKPGKREGFAERHRQVLLAQKTGRQHIGLAKDVQQMITSSLATNSLDAVKQSD